MKRNRLYIATLIAISSLTILQSCDLFEKEEPHDCEGLNRPPEYYKLSEGQKAILPYTGYDTISMVSNMGDTIHCIGTGKQYFNTMEFKESGIALCASYGTELYYEAYKIEFIDSVRKPILTVAQYLYYFFQNSASAFDIIQIKFNYCDGVFIIRSSDVSNENSNNYIGDIIINNTQFLKVNKGSRYNELEHRKPMDTISYMLISKQLGVLKLHLSQDNSWEIIPH